MAEYISIDQYYRDYAAWPMIDVRSPGEYLSGHIIGAQSVPLFSDEERAVVGTTYKQVSREAAMEVGRGYVSPKLGQFVDDALTVAPDQRAVVHCWRGGMRSQAFADHLSQQGFTDVRVIEGGYKAYRIYMRSVIGASYNIVILSGYTGTGKTAILHALSNLGEQILDLEGLANHKGSAFGAIGERPQPTTEHFHNLIFQEIRTTSSTRRLWIEDEAVMIGRVNLPMELYSRMKVAPAVSVVMDQDLRAQRLVIDYAGRGDDLLHDAIMKIRKRMGGQHANQALALLHDQQYAEVAKLCLTYYDKYYQKSIEKRAAADVHTIETHDSDAHANALMLIEEADKLKL